MQATEHLDDNARYRALCSHDARFDGRLFVGVTSTGIYCRPVCRVRTPRRENCRFFEHAAQAEHAGFRPCLRCRPELAPLQRHWSHEDAQAILAQQATRWLDDPAQWSATEAATPTLERLSARLGVSSRHLRRVFEAQLGVSPMQYLLTRKLLTAKQLLADTRLPITQVAQASGFASLRRFNAAFAEHYGLNPTQLRAEGARDRDTQTPRPVALTWRPPYDAAALLRFLADRQLPGVEQVDATTALLFERTARLEHAGRVHSGWFQARFEPQHNRLWLSVSPTLHPALPALIWRVRALFDLDADPLPINSLLHADFPAGDGLRVPGAFDGFELAVRAVLGQQVTVAVARTLAARLAERLGEPMNTGHTRLHRLFPSADTLARVDAQVLGDLGIVRQRQAALQALARAVLDGLNLNSNADHEHTTQALMGLPGIGPWTAQYIAMRALRWPDAWPVGDVVLTHALGLPAHRSTAAHRQAQQISQRWQPWRSYAVIRAWAGAHVSQEGLA